MTAPLHRSINWPAGVDLNAVSMGIYTCLLHYFDTAGIAVTPIVIRYKLRLMKMLSEDRDLNDPDVRRAAMWSAVMRTAIEMYGLKA